MNLKKTVSRKKAQKTQENFWGYAIQSTNHIVSFCSHCSMLFFEDFVPFCGNELLDFA